MTLGSMELFRDAYAAQRQITTQIPIEFRLLVIGLGLGLDHCQCKCTKSWTIMTGIPDQNVYTTFAGMYQNMTE